MAMTESEKEHFVKLTLARDALWKLFHNEDHRKARKLLLLPPVARDPKLKGIAGGNCNRTACQSPGAVFVHRFNGPLYYCYSCAHDINVANLDYMLDKDNIDMVTLDLEVLATLTKD